MVRLGDDFPTVASGKYEIIALTFFLNKSIRDFVAVVAAQCAANRKFLERLLKDGLG